VSIGLWGKKGAGGFRYKNVVSNILPRPRDQRLIGPSGFFGKIYLPSGSQSDARADAKERMKATVLLHGEKSIMSKNVERDCRRGGVGMVFQKINPVSDP